MEVLFEDEALEELYLSGKSSDKKYKKLSRDQKLVEGFRRAVDVMRSLDNVTELKNYSFLHYERLIFIEREEGIEVLLLEIDNTHYGNKG